jgi:predicted alpha/beta superfamily hydrolase
MLYDAFCITDEEARLEITGWRDFTEDKTEHTVVGTVLVLTDVYSPQLQNRRDIFVYLPPSYAISDRRYPVLYIHDGQNLFDAFSSYAGEWQVDETMQVLSDEGIEALVVGVANAGVRRMNEYNPFDHPRFGKGQGDAYLTFLGDTVKPLIDTDFRTLTGRDSTGIMGSSMGGLISLYAFFRLPQVFGFAGAVSPSLHIGGNALDALIQTAPFVPGKIYIDVGTHEMGTSWKEQLSFHRASRRYTDAVRRLHARLLTKGYSDGVDLVYVEEQGGRHNEVDWARRLPDALRFLLRGPEYRTGCDWD